MLLSELTTIGAEDLPIQSLKDHLRLGSGFAEDDLQDPLLETYLRTAISVIEGKIGIILVARNFALDITDWPRRDKLAFPVRPVSQINAIERETADGDKTALDGTEFQLVRDSLTPCLKPTSAQFPHIPAGQSVIITFTAGFGSVWDSVPSDLFHAVLVLAAHFYENRSGTFDANTPLPMVVQSLIERHRPVRLFKGV